MNTIQLFYHNNQRVLNTFLKFYVIPGLGIYTYVTYFKDKNNHYLLNRHFVAMITIAYYGIMICHEFRKL